MPNTWDSSCLFPSPSATCSIIPKPCCIPEPFCHFPFTPQHSNYRASNPDFAIKPAAPCSGKIDLLQALLGSNKAKILRGYFWRVEIWVDAIFFLVLFYTLNSSIEKLKTKCSVKTKTKIRRYLLRRFPLPFPIPTLLSLIAFCYFLSWSLPHFAVVYILFSGFVVSLSLSLAIRP